MQVLNTKGTVVFVIVERGPDDGLVRNIPHPFELDRRRSGFVALHWSKFHGSPVLGDERGVRPCERDPDCSDEAEVVVECFCFVR
jgi:hypothetical protein